jgi:hypothetical protein
VGHGIRDAQTDQPLTHNEYDTGGGNGGSFDMHGAQAGTLYYFSVEGGTSAGTFGGYNYTGWVTPIELTLNQVTHPQPPMPPASPGPLLVFPSAPDTDPKFVVAGQGFQVTWTDWNVGGTATGAYRDTVAIFGGSNPYDLNDVSTALWHEGVDVSSLAPGQQANLSVDATALPAGAYVVEVVQDSGGMVNEVTRAYNRDFISPLSVDEPMNGLPPGLGLGGLQGLGSLGQNPGPSGPGHPLIIVPPRHRPHHRGRGGRHHR